jgi:hypothetical protein
MSGEVFAETAGEPLHTRMLTLEVRQAEGARLAVRGEVIDLRKRGLVPVPGSFQLPGVIHRMELEATLDPAERRVETLEVRQPVVAFEASEATGGESCRDPAAALRSLAGARLDGAFLKRLSAAYGGPRGCTHLLTLARLFASSAARALDLEASLPPGARAPGERAFRRVLALDGFEAPGGALHLCVQLSDVHLARRAEARGANAFDQLASQAEVRVSATLEIAGTALRSLRAEERTRTRSQLGSTGYRDRSGELREWLGRPLVGGIAPELVRRFAGEPGSTPLLDALLNLAPGYIQCVAAVSDIFLSAGTVSPAAGVGGQPDSCFMWREGSALRRAYGARTPPK